MGNDIGMAYAALNKEARKDVHARMNKIADITDAIQHGFKAEPDLAPCHLPLLSDDALARIFTESENWRDKSHERALEQIIRDKQEESDTLNRYYVNLRGILDALDVPNHFRPIDGNPKHIAWTEQKARELVKKADDSDRNRRAAVNAEQRVDLLERYVKACDLARLPYNWNVFKLPTAALRDTVYAAETTERLTNCDTNADRVNYLATRKAQDTEQSLRWHARNAEKCRRLIEQFTGTRFGTDTADSLLDALLDRPQTGEQTPAWTTWEWGYAPKDITRDTLLELRLKSGDVVILDSSVVEWADVEAYRPAK